MPVKGDFMKQSLIIILLFAMGTHARADYVQDSADLARHIMKERLKEKDDLKGQDNNTINQGANVGQASQNAGSAANAAAGAALIASGMALLPNPPTAAQGAALIAMGMLALAQAGHDSGAAGASARTAAASVLKNDAKAGDTQQPVGGGEAEFFNNERKKAAEALKAQGYSFSDKGLTGPDGKTVPASAFSSPGAMAAAGIDPNAIKELNKVNAAIADELSKYRVSSVAAGGAGAGMNEGGGAGGAASEEQTGGVVNPFDINAERQKQLMNGKTVSLDGEPIGVAGANIFEMVHDAYQKKRSGNQFIEIEGMAPVRAPASTKSK